MIVQVKGATGIPLVENQGHPVEVGAARVDVGNWISSVANEILLRSVYVVMLATPAYEVIPYLELGYCRVVITAKLCRQARGRGQPMEARRLIDGAAFGPGTLKVIGRAFDEAWQDIAGNFGEDRVLAARLKLANIILTTATSDRRNVAALKEMAL